MTWLNWPNRITVARILLVPPLVICLLRLDADPWRYAALALFTLMAASDGLDGYLARRLHQETAVGRFLDPVADKLLIASAVVILAIESTAVPGFRLPSWVPVVAIAKDLITVIGFSLIYAATGMFFVQPRPLGKLCTLVQLIMVAASLIAPDLPSPFRVVWQGAYGLATLMAVLAVTDYLIIGNRFAADASRNRQD